ncbi:hypothetical protein H9X86_07510 [Pseudoflavonifractor capillosus]|uniref:PBECR4 domain-containing protein n=1 Tax=Pseudoflavonifractor capillosus TaxID=106588 RepID=UPI00195B4912|nr:PBECR4 domain-containing protein [Pseudoflavonifractor capillosus]MBM6897217.1 hypothetical protein [Pseudoflavonifractor capillosus]
MDILHDSAQAFFRLLDYEYDVVIGRKGQSIAFTIAFDKSHFHHLAGLHKMRDMPMLSRGKRERIFDHILSGKMTQAQVEKSIFFQENIRRLEHVAQLESLLDNNRLIFRYLPQKAGFSKIQADFVLEHQLDAQIFYLFLIGEAGGQRQICTSFFPKEHMDYTKGQSKYTLLKKVKRNIRTGECMIQVNRLSPK